MNTLKKLLTDKKLKLYKLWLLFGMTVILFGFSPTMQAQNQSPLNNTNKKIIDNSCEIPFELKLFKDLDKVGHVYLLLEPQYFKPQKLRTLFLCLSRKYSKFADLSITAFSSEENLKLQIRNNSGNTMEELYTSRNEPMDRSKEDCKNLDKAVNPCPIGYYRAFYSRFAPIYSQFEREYFKYSPNPNKKHMVTITLKNKVRKNSQK